jgi:L-threonylcarbamoyladenylate synthase
MKMFSLSSSARQSEFVHIAELTAKILSQEGAVALIPTETVYGLVCRWDDNEARNKIIKIKQRPAEKRFQMFATCIEQAKKWGCIFDESAEKIALKFFPGPLTLIVPSKYGGTVGVRISNYPFIKILLEKTNFPLAGTSANLSGDNNPPNKVSAILASFCQVPDVTVDAGKITGIASTVAAINDGKIKILRCGPITEKSMSDALNLSER